VEDDVFDNINLVGIEQEEYDISSKPAIVKSILKIAIPSLMTLVLGELIWITNITYCARLGDEHMLSGLGLAFSLSVAIPLSLTYGLSGVLETLVSQAYGSKQLHLCGVYLNKQIFIIACLFFPIGLLLFNIKFFLVNYFGQNETTSMYCQMVFRA
jgi:Na+-driven multidrug efflux pump